MPTNFNSVLYLLNNLLNHKKIEMIDELILFMPALCFAFIDLLERDVNKNK